MTRLRPSPDYPPRGMEPESGRRRTAVVCIGRSVVWEEIALMIPETVLVAEPRLSSALEQCFLGAVYRLVVDLTACDSMALSALAYLHSVRPEQEMLLLQAKPDAAPLQHTSLADLPVAQFSPGLHPGMA